MTVAARSIIAMALTLTLGASLSCKGQARDSAQAAEPQPAPAFATRTLSGEDASLAELQGQVVLLNVWATWCEPCVRELPVLADMHRELGEKGFTVIALNGDVRAKLPAVRNMVASQDLPYPVWLDFESRAQVVFKLRGYPTSFLIDRKGNIRWKREGEIMANDPELMPVLEQLLAE